VKTERELIEGLKNGSVDDFHELYSIYSGRLFSYCMNFTKREEDAEDIVQDVFVRLWEYRSKIRTDIPAASLLFIMSRNMLVTAYRDLIQSRKYEDYIAYRQSLPAGDPSRALQFKDYLELVKNKVEKLPRSQRRIFILSRFDGLSNEEISETLSLSLQTVKNQLSQATKKIREMIDYEGA